MTRCCAKTLQGRRCKKSATDGFCWMHAPKDECNICLETVKCCKQLDCSHKFCKVCINKWIINTQTPCCPNCRHEINKIHVISAFNWAEEQDLVYLMQLNIFDINKLDDVDALLVSAACTIHEFGLVTEETIKNIFYLLHLNDNTILERINKVKRVRQCFKLKSDNNPTKLYQFLF